MENIVIEKTGVVYFHDGYESYLKVDSVDLLAELSEQLERSRHSADIEGRFAGRVKIEIEFLGEPKELENAE